MGHGILARILLALVLVSGVVAEFSSTDDHLSLPRFGKVILDPIVEYLGQNNTLTLWQIPHGHVRKVLFIAVGSGSYPWSYFDPTDRCPLCTGLPEMRKIALDALEHSYAVVVISPLNLGGEYVAWPRNSPDMINVKVILAEWKRRHGLENVPIVALGSSAGGHALSTLGLDGTRLFQSMVIMVSKGVRQAWRAARPGYPPTLFVHCPKDDKSADSIDDVMARLRELGTPTEQVKWLEHPITPTWFSELVPDLDPPTSNAMYNAFKRSGVILDKDDYLLAAQVHWAPVLREKHVLPEDPKNPGKLLFAEAISQEMRVAFAMHSTVSRLDEKIFSWFGGNYTWSSTTDVIANQ